MADSDIIDTIYVEFSLSLNSSIAEESYVGEYGIEISLSLELQCAANFYGPSCDNYCVPQDNSGGHYSCGSGGEKICLSGWSDPSGDCLTGKCNYSLTPPFRGTESAEGAEGGLKFQFVSHPQIIHRHDYIFSAYL